MSQRQKNTKLEYIDPPDQQTVVEDVEEILSDWTDDFDYISIDISVGEERVLYTTFGYVVQDDGRIHAGVATEDRDYDIRGKRTMEEVIVRAAEIVALEVERALQD